MSILFLVALSTVGTMPEQVRSEVQVEDAGVKLIREVRLPVSEAGTMMEILVKEGDLVVKGDLLARSDDRLEAINKSIADLEQLVATERSENDVDERYARKSLAVAESELQLSVDAVKRVPGSISQTELAKLRLVVEQAKLSIEQAQRDHRIAKLTKELKSQSVAAAEEKLDRHRINAPFAGMIVELLAQPDEWLDPGQPILRIVQLDRLRVEVNLDGKLHGAELKGRPVRLRVAVPPGDREEEFEGKVTFVSPELQPVTGQVRVWAEVENRDLILRPGNRGTLTIMLKE